MTWKLSFHRCTFNKINLKKIWTGICTSTGTIHVSKRVSRRLGKTEKNSSSPYLWRFREPNFFPAISRLRFLGVAEEKLSDGVSRREEPLDDSSGLLNFASGCQLYRPALGLVWNNQLIKEMLNIKSYKISFYWQNNHLDSTPSLLQKKYF